MVDVGWSTKKLRFVRVGGKGQAVFGGDVTMTTGGSSARVVGIDAVGAMIDISLVFVSDRFVSGKVLSSPAGEPVIALTLMSRRSAGSWAVFRCLEKQPSWLLQSLIQKTRGFSRVAGL